MPRLRHAVVLIAVDCSPCRAVAKPQSVASIVQYYDKWLSEADPIGAAARGNQAAAALWPDDSFRAVHMRTAELERLKSALEDVPETGLSGEDALNAKMLKWPNRYRAAGGGVRRGAYPVHQRRRIFRHRPLRGAGHRAAYACRSAKLAHQAFDIADLFLRSETQNMRRGQRTGFCATADHGAGGGAHGAATGRYTRGSGPVFWPRLRRCRPIRGAAWRAKGLLVIHNLVKDAERNLAEYFEKSYVPSSRETLGASALPNGAAYYAYLVRRETTTEMTPDQIFELGQSEIKRIRAAMQVQIAASGFNGDFAAFQEMLRHDPRFYVTTREALLEKASPVWQNALTTSCRASSENCLG